MLVPQKVSQNKDARSPRRLTPVHFDARFEGCA